jgi:AcrR family transcriptional regulator
LPRKTSIGARRELILAEAARSLNRRGVADTALAEIARAVGVTRAALYYYFADQEDLVFQSYRHSCEVLGGHLDTAIAAGGDTRSIIGRFVDEAADPARPELATLCEVAALGEDKRAVVTGLYEGLAGRLAALIAQGAARGEARDCDPRIAALAILGLVSWIPLQERWTSSAPFSHAGLAAAARSLILSGAAAPDRQALDYTPLALRPADIPSHGVFDGRVLALAKQEALLAAASRLFNLKGVDTTSLDEIAAQVGVTKKVIYHNIGDKAALLVAC